ncbi:MAG: 2-oxoacid:acceptor oxidoreductase family protein, partial [Planctomycetota bacterium]
MPGRLAGEEERVEIRLHGRGGQGGVTCAKILAAAYARLGKNVQTFGDYSGERSGAPVRAYTRVSDDPITNRNKVYRPDHLVVLDSSLLGADTVAGLAPGGTLLLNTSEPLEAIDGKLAAFRIAVVDATTIARSHGIGSRSLVIVNTTLAGAFARLHEIDLDVLEQTYHSLGLLSNFPAAREAYGLVQIRPA